MRRRGVTALRQAPISPADAGLAVQPLTRVTLADNLVTQLRRQILTGRLQPGQLIPAELDLCSAFGVGRTTVREALRGLVAAGFAERQGKRLVVTDTTRLGQDELDYAALAARVSVRDLYETRKLLEVQLAKLAAEHHSQDALDGVLHLLEVSEQADGPSYHHADADFHTAIARLGKNLVLTQVYESSRDMFFRLPTYWRLFGQDTPGGIDGAKGGHRRIVEAIAARDSEAAARAAFDHLDVVERRLIAAIDPANEHAATRRSSAVEGAAVPSVASTSVD
jgi:GntR family transcriptional repressor for pyruvate dehydrogenase complex